ncbi:hypothetical protein ACQ86N_18175 [Puia sp. P3]|uniref:hypothetical protein n=1 Tax=Puia sp. P3 TaxID=3423952 RepID=UPI003D66E3BD
MPFNGTEIASIGQHVVRQSVLVVIPEILIIAGWSRPVGIHHGYGVPLPVVAKDIISWFSGQGNYPEVGDSARWGVRSRVFLDIVIDFFTGRKKGKGQACSETKEADLCHKKEFEMVKK